ncbi:DUF3750 domain-containing protein [Modicisalibacter coralii]|uniref:DUF3750 domain-containing protein n=1 Tax=Modicisalibacter coralii TaxID=2304602 RepID=UPI00100ABFEB|nr:DUF3750 domain-containing protein [Halomonas coralii]
MRRRAWAGWGLGVLLALMLGGPLAMLASPGIDLTGNWATSDRSPTGLAPPASTTREAVVQVYAARAFEWRGAFAVHTWIAAKSADARRYRVYQVTSWRRPPVSVGAGTPDRAWFGSRPWLLADYRGTAAAAMIPAIEMAVRDYPAPARYRAWPGPNSNTFVAWVVRRVPGLDVALPVTAIGRDFVFDGPFVRAPSATGWQFSAFGLLAVTVAADEGLEVTLLGLTLGVDVRRPALKWPGLGRLGMAARVAGNAEHGP